VNYNEQEKYPRSAVDTVEDLGDVVGFYTQCVSVVLGDGRIVRQGAYPGETHCDPTFKDAWAQLLNAQWNQVQSVKLFFRP